MKTGTDRRNPAKLLAFIQAMENTGWRDLAQPARAEELVKLDIDKAMAELERTPAIQISVAATEIIQVVTALQLADFHPDFPECTRTAVEEFLAEVRGPLRPARPRADGHERRGLCRDAQGKAKGTLR